MKVIPIFEYPVCCVCFNALNENHVVHNGKKYDVCLKCEDKVSWDHE